MIMHTLTLFIFLLWQQLPPLLEPAQKGWFRESLDLIGSIVTPFAAIGLLVAIAYFFWHSKNREELTKALAEATSLANTRGERIKDLEKLLTEKDAMLATKEAKLLLNQQEKLLWEEEDEKRAKTEFRLRAEIADLEKRFGVK